MTDKERYNRMAELCVAMEGLADVLALRDDIHAAEMLGRLRGEFNDLFTSKDADSDMPEETETAVTAPAADADEPDPSTEEKGAEPARDLVSCAGICEERNDTESADKNDVGDNESTGDISSEGNFSEAPAASEDDAVGGEGPEAADDSEQTAPAESGFRQYDLRVDEMLSRREARQLRKAFTLNDKFRFRRELFDNDSVLFGETIDMIEAMKDLDEAAVYVRDDLGWDMDNEHVKDFMAVVANHFAEV